MSKLSAWDTATSKSHKTSVLPSWRAQSGQGGYACIQALLSLWWWRDAWPTIGTKMRVSDHTWSGDRKSFLEMMPELNLKDQSEVSQANQAMGKVTWAERRVWEEAEKSEPLGYSRQYSTHAREVLSNWHTTLWSGQEQEYFIHKAPLVS